MAKTDIKKAKAQQEQSNEILENPEVIADRLGRGEAFLRKNSKIVGGIIIAAVLIIAGVLVFQIHRANQNVDAQAEMFQAVYYWEQDELDLALNGDGENVGLLYIADEYSGTEAANLANFYIGSIYLSEGQFQQAIDHLKNFSSSDFFVQARAYALIGDAYMELGNTSEAIRNYKRAADYKENPFFTPRYLQKLAIAHEEAGDISSAISAWETIENEYFESYEFTAARKHKARLEGLASR